MAKPKVYLVDRKCLDAVQAGKFHIPTGEIWVDNLLSPDEQRLLILRETAYFKKMTNKRKTGYQEAHKDAQ